MPAGIVNRVLGESQSAAGKAGEAIGSTIGNQTLEDYGHSHAKEGERKVNQSTSETVSGGPFSATTGGGVAKQHSDRTEGSWNSKVGSAKESVGDFVGSDSLRQSGTQQEVHGNTQKATGQVKDAAQGVSDRITGTVGGAAAGLVGNDVKQRELNRRAEDGQARMGGVGHDVKGSNH